jgi:hypothetical protein
MHEGVGGVASSLLQVGGYSQGVALLAGLALSLIAAGVVVIALEHGSRGRLTAMVRELSFGSDPSRTGKSA